MEAREASEPGFSTDRPPAAPVLTLLRHGESAWNREGRFTGWVDVELTDEGMAEARRAGRLLARYARPVDCCFASDLRRAVRTAEAVLHETGRPGVPVTCTWRLNERHYGVLQGLTAWSAVQRYGPLRVLRTRRRFDVRPPLARRRPQPRGDEADEALPPHGESLADTLARVRPCWEQDIVPQLAAGRHVLVVSHKHTLRALVRILRELAPGCLPRGSLATATPLLITMEAGDVERVGRAAAEAGARRELLA